MAYKLCLICDRCKESATIKEHATLGEILVPAKALVMPDGWMRGGHIEGLCPKCRDEKDRLRARQQQEMESFMAMGVWDFSRQAPWVVFLAGFFCGHLFWGNPDIPDPGPMIKK